MKVYIPPIKSQGIKSKLVPWINDMLPYNIKGRWIEPFMGTGVVGFNLAGESALMCDTNPHLIEFYQAIQNGEITPDGVRSYLNKEGSKLLEIGEKYYYEVRKRFNLYHDPLDFLFLNRAGFNGMIRFNKKGEFNIPFCKKPQRFARAYVTKIVNQISYVSNLFKKKSFVFKCQSFQETIDETDSESFIYCDPPYIDRHTDYYNGWDEEKEQQLYKALLKTKAKFILSTWHHNKYRENEYIKTLWKEFNILTKEHFYHIGGSEKNRNSMIEALITNYKISPIDKLRSSQIESSSPGLLTLT